MSLSGVVSKRQALRGYKTGYSSITKKDQMQALKEGRSVIRREQGKGRTHKMDMIKRT